MMLASSAAARAADVLESLRPGHPRLLVLDDDVARLKRQIASDASAKTYFEHIRTVGDKLLTEPPSERKLIGPRLLHVSRQVLGRVATLGGLYRLTGDAKYAKRCREEMLAAAAFADWNPSHFLDTAEMSNALGIGYDWIFATLSEDDRRTIRTAMIEKGLKPGLKVYESDRGWHERTNNWNQVCNGGLTVGALAIADEDPAIARQIVDHARKSIPIAMKEYAPDGGIAEGPGYWSYATYYSVFYLAAIQTALGDDLGLRKSPGFAEAGMFRIQTIGPLNRTFNFADAGDGVGGAEEMFYLARAFDRPIYAAHERKLLAKNRAIGPFHLLWFEGGGDTKDLPPAAYFRHVEVATFRSAWDDPNAAFVGFKGGDNAASHSNLDLGTFVYDVNGVRWARDLGPDDYNLPGYFGKQRWTYYRLRTEGQNTLTIDGENQNVKGKSKIVAFRAGPNRKFAVADLSDGYAGQATSVTRGVELIGKQLLIQDEVHADKPVDIVWHMHTSATIELAEDGRRATLSQDGKRVVAHLSGGSPGRFDVAVADPPPAVEADPPMRAKGQRNSQKLVVRMPAKSDKLLLTVQLVPEGERAAQRRIVLLKDWK